MVFGAIEIIALIFAILIIVKLLFVLFSPKSWFNFAKKIYGSPRVLVIVELILVLIIFYYLLQSLSIVQIMAAVVLGALLTGMGFAVYAKETMAWSNKLMKQKGLLKKAWLPVLIWLILVIWTLIALF